MSEATETQRVDETAVHFVRRMRKALEEPEVDFDLKTAKGQWVFDHVSEAWRHLRAAEMLLCPEECVRDDGQNGFKLANFGTLLAANLVTDVIDQRAGVGKRSDA